MREMPVRTVLERGPKGKKVVAFALDWPGWSRGAKTSEEALATLESYRQRYQRVATRARMTREFDEAGALKVIEDRVGTGSTDFWGISFSPSALEQGPMDDHEFTRKVKLLRACWSYFDDVAARVSPEMRKGIRGGGRERDEIIRHTSRHRDRALREESGRPGPRRISPQWREPPRVSRGLRHGTAGATHGRPHPDAHLDSPVPDPP